MCGLPVGLGAKRVTTVIVGGSVAPAVRDGDLSAGAPWRAGRAGKGNGILPGPRDTIRSVRARPLSVLLREALGLAWEGPGDPLVERVTEDSREVIRGSLFLAIRGRRDGHLYAAEAQARGAIAVVAERPLDLKVPVVVVEDSRSALAILAAALEDWPARRLRLIGVTGTDGKTTTTWLIHHALQAAGVETGLVGGLGNRIGSSPLEPQAGHYTTQPAPALHAALRQIAEAGCSTAVLEVSSHSLAQQRTAGLDFEIGVFTNLSPEHLDFHGTMDAYLEAKAMLTDSARVAVINLAEAAAGRLLAGAQRAVTYADSRLDADVQAVGVTAISRGYRVQVHVGRAVNFEFELPLPGRYNVANALAALAAAWQAGLRPAEAAESFRTFRGVPGRMQVVADAPRVVVDFAHTPAALARVLTDLKASTRGRLLVVVGAPGERDPTKRAPMGEIAARLADLVVLTEDDSRSEPREAILAEMMSGAQLAPLGAERTLVVPDRGEAISTAIRAARGEDTVLLAGKGAEATLERGDAVLPWDEARAAAEVLAERDAEPA